MRVLLPAAESVVGQLVEFVGHHPYLIGALLVSLAAVLLYELRLRAGGVTHVSAADAVRLINRGALVIDVRKPTEFEAGHIVNARNIELDRLQQENDAIAKKKDKILLAVCENGGLPMTRSNESAGSTPCVTSLSA